MRGLFLPRKECKMLEIGTPVRVRKFNEIEPVEWYIHRPELECDYYGLGKSALDDLNELGECVVVRIDTDPEPFSGEFTSDGNVAYQLRWPDGTEFDDWAAESYWFLENMLEVLLPDDGDLPDGEPDDLFGGLFEVAVC